MLTGGRALNLNGATTWTGNTGNNNNILAVSNSTINNTGTFSDTNGFNALVDTAGVTAFNNFGTFNKQGASTTVIETPFNNTNLVNVDAGRLHLLSGASSGTFNLADGATLSFVFGTHAFNAATVAGPGTLQVGGGTLVVNGGSYSAALLLSSGILSGSNAVFTAPATWTGGGISGAGSTTFESALAITGATGKSISGTRVVNLSGTTTWSGNTAHNNNALFFNNGTFNNSGTFNDENGFNSLMDTLGATAFNNTGTYNKNGSATTLIEVAFNNTAAVNVNAGTLNVQSAFDNAGTITTATGATFGTTNLFNDLENRGVLQGTGSYDPAAGRSLLNGGQVHPGTPTSVGDLSISGDFRQSAMGLIEFNLLSLTEFDTLDVLGNLNLDGVLHVSSLGGYNPNDTDTFTIITFDDGVADANDRTGGFSGLTFSGFRPDVSFRISYLDHAVVLVAGVPEPSLALLLAAGTLLVGGGARRELARAVSRRQQRTNEGCG